MYNRALKIARYARALKIARHARRSFTGASQVKGKYKSSANRAERRVGRAIEYLAVHSTSF
jgi:hypothetical protein